jgi:FdhD protein
MDGRRTGQTRVRMRAVDAGIATSRIDLLATEEPMEIRLRAGRRVRPIAVTMRTPGADFELAAGFLFSEGIITSRDDLSRVEYCVECEGDAAQQYNIVTVVATPNRRLDLRGLDRNFGMTSACGLCGKERLDQIERRGIVPPGPGPSVEHRILTTLPQTLHEAQGIFSSTGGLHAAGLFTSSGELIAIREDVGRHNAVDKVVGWALLEGRLPLGAHILMVSGRSSFEIAQKCLVAGIPVLCAVSAPSSLAVDLARRFGLTLVGFLRSDRFNVYSGAERIRLSSSP